MLLTSIWMGAASLRPNPAPVLTHPCPAIPGSSGESQCFKACRQAQSEPGDITCRRNPTRRLSKSLRNALNYISLSPEEGVMAELYPALEPYVSHRLAVDLPHVLYVEECGNPQGLPVLFVHGGPGGGCNGDSRRFFDPRHYRAVLFDQRGCGRSKPH